MKTIHRVLTSATHRRHLSKLALLLATVLPLLATPARAANNFFSTNRLSPGRYGHIAQLLPNGKVLIAGGIDDGGHYLATAQIYEPLTGNWVTTGTMSIARDATSSVLLPNGRVLVAGGTTGPRTIGGSNMTNTAEIYDPATGQWTPTGSMLETTSAPAFVLSTGKVLALSPTTAELYDPATGTWAFTGSPLAAHTTGNSVLLSSGKVLYTGGAAATSRSSAAELYNPATGTWAFTGSMVTPRAEHTLTLLADGRVLAAGGSGGLDVNNASLANAEIYNPTTGTWAATGSLITGRENFTATLLPSGLVLAVGGQKNGLPLASSELFNLATGTWTASGNLPVPRLNHSAVLLANGRVLIPGGYSDQASGYVQARAEIYQPNGSTNDFDQDGNPDLILFNAANGQTKIESLKLSVCNSTVAGPTITAGWQLVRTGDFNGDGKPDLYLSNPTTHALAVWLMNGATYSSSLSLPTIPSGCELSGVADFEHDGSPDLLLTTPSNRFIAFWLLNGTTLGQTPYLRNAAGTQILLSQGFKIVSTVDMNGDGQIDLVLFNATTGQTQIWYLNGRTYVSQINGPTIPAGWVLSSVNDINGDGRPDFVVSAASTSATAFRYLNLPDVTYTPMLRDSAGVQIVQPAGFSIVSP